MKDDDDRNATATTPVACVPRATYRLQMHAGFDFDAAIGVLPYLHRLGVSHVYCSPLTRARPGSLHGYDVVAYDEINPELGGRAGFDRFASALHRHGLRLLLDIVPNHMGIGPDNAWWMDVLENGEASPYARFFDIDWHPAERTLAHKVLLPVLGDHYGRLLDAGALSVVLDPARSAFELRYAEHRFPIDPGTTAPLLRDAAQRCDGPARDALLGQADALDRVPHRDDPDPLARASRAGEMARLKTSLVRLLADMPSVRVAIDASLAAANTPDALDALHEAQAWRVAFWRVAADEINYRRFFDVNELAALRMEDPVVFETTHALVLDLAAAGLVDGLRVDHPDGLLDPAQYFERLQQGYAARLGLPPLRRDATGRLARPLYVVAEKIAAGHEDVPDTWAVHGATGYRFANVVNGVLIDTHGRMPLDRIWRRFSGETADFAELAYRGKREVLRHALFSELGVQASELLRLARETRRGRDFTLHAVRDALAEVAACMSVYRTYIVTAPSPQDRRFIERAVDDARLRLTAPDDAVLEFIRDALLGRVDGSVAAPGREAHDQRALHVAMRFQQLTSPVAAKGVEDTAFYRYHRLVALNEVGGDPGTFGFTRAEFHAATADRSARWPHTLIATSTHDNKRSEDVRCRLDVLSERPAAWRLLLRRLATSAAGSPRVAGDDDAPSRSDQMLLVQTALGTWPSGAVAPDELDAWRGRLERYAIKAAREAKQRTGWVAPDDAYEASLVAFVHGLVERVRSLGEVGTIGLASFAAEVARAGALNSVGMVALKMTSPGVPDVYQGNELVDLSLVDPDNRRPVDFVLRSRRLDELAALVAVPDKAAELAAMVCRPEDGRLKMWVTWRLLQLRAADEALFRDGAYEPLIVDGPSERRVVAFARMLANRRVCVAIGRFHSLAHAGDARPAGDARWYGTTLALPSLEDGTLLRNWLTDETVMVANGAADLSGVFATMPFAVLIAQDPDTPRSR